MRVYNHVLDYVAGALRLAVDAGVGQLQLAKVRVERRALVGWHPYSERAPSKQYDRRVSRSLVEPLHLYYHKTPSQFPPIQSPMRLAEAVGYWLCRSVHVVGYVRV